MKVKAAAATALVLVFCSSLAAAGPVVDAATRVEALLAEGKTVEALAAMASVAEAICAASPLVFRNVAIVESAGGDADYSERADKSFKPDEKLRMRFEPLCLRPGTDGKVGLKSDLTFENMTGQVFGEAADVFTVSGSSQGFSPVLSFGVPYLRPGEYKVTFTVHDQNSDKTGTIELPFTITLPTAN